MLLRFVAENIMSFKDAVEFNTFPSSKSRSHSWHKVDCGHATILRMSAIYGANGAGKSNLLKCISLLKSMVIYDKLGDVGMPEVLNFCLDDECASKPSELAIEFFAAGHVFYYHIVFSRNDVFEEVLSLSNKSSDELIFSRKGGRIEINNKFMSVERDGTASEVFQDAMSRVIRQDMLAFSFFGKYYPKELPLVKEAFQWVDRLQVVMPEMQTGDLPHILDTLGEFKALVNTVIPDLMTGISRLEIRKEAVNEEDLASDTPLATAVKAAKALPGYPVALKTSRYGLANVVVENDTAYIKTLVAIHVDSNSNEVEMPLGMESDGTQRLTEYMPILYSVFKAGNVFIVDEIERSIHPIMIKTLMRKLSESKEAKGQIIFTTHESCLLDQSIFRPDEIWLTQKDVDQSTQMYPLSDYNIHKTANIENGYLNGRYGGIPFLSNLEDLRW